MAPNSPPTHDRVTRPCPTGTVATGRAASSEADPTSIQTADSSLTRTSSGRRRADALSYGAQPTRRIRMLTRLLILAGLIATLPAMAAESGHKYIVNERPGITTPLPFSDA